MARMPRTILPGSLHEVTIKTFQARFLLTPDGRLNDLVVGVLARAQRLFGLTVCAVVVLSNHLHLLVVPDSEHQLMRFCQFAAANISREVGRLRNWTGGIFRRRYNLVVVSDEPVAQVARLRYLLSHGVKEGLVKRPQDWPGIHCVRELLAGRLQMPGLWVDRTALYSALRKSRRIGRKSAVREADYEQLEVLHLAKLPCWAHLSDEAYQKAIAELVADILLEHQERIATIGPRAIDRIRRQDPEHRPVSTKKSPRPLCHAASRAERRQLHQLLRDWINAYYQASRRFLAGDRSALDAFPPGAFLPPLALASSLAPPAAASP
jgi:REP element-mobilizing transposase RayT